MARAGVHSNPSFGYVFPSIRGVQAGREFYVSMCPMRLIPKVFLFDEDELAPEIRAQRTLNKGRLPDLVRYMVANRDNYVFSALTASIDGDLQFESIGTDSSGSLIGQLHVAMNARFIINDGQHRRAAIEAAIKEDETLANESIAVVFFVDVGLKRCQQMFADLNRHAIRPSTSIGILFDHRDQHAELARAMVLTSSIFKNMVEMERSSLSPRSRKLFTLSAIYNATTALLAGRDDLVGDDRLTLARSYWEEVAKQFPEWLLVRDHKLSAGEVRTDYIHTHGIVMQSLGRVGNALLKERSKDWKKQIKLLQNIDWSRANTALWEGRAMIGGRLAKGDSMVTLTTNTIKKTLDLPLMPEEQRIEQQTIKGSAR
jgi:DNA sulfur modification protein DndB